LGLAEGGGHRLVCVVDLHTIQDHAANRERLVVAFAVNRDIELWCSLRQLLRCSLPDHRTHVFKQHRNCLQLAFRQGLSNRREAERLQLVQKLGSRALLLQFEKLQRSRVVVVRCSLATVEPFDDARGDLPTGSTAQNLRIAPVGALLNLLVGSTPTAPPLALIVADGSRFGYILAVKIRHG